MTPYARKLLDLIAEAASILDKHDWRGARAALRRSVTEAIEQGQSGSAINTDRLTVLLNDLRQVIDMIGWQDARTGLRHEIDLAWSVQAAVNRLLPGLDTHGAFQEEQQPDWSDSILDYVEQHGTIVMPDMHEGEYGGR